MSDIPAFPRPYSEDDSEVAKSFVGTRRFHYAQSGMTLRHYYAAKAMQGLLGKDYANVEIVAEKAFEIADAMIQHS